MVMIRHTLFFLVLCVMLLSAGSCGRKEPEPQPVIRPVRFEVAFSTGSARVRTFSGVAEAGVASRLSFKVAGTVRRVPVEVGDQVRAGDLIAELDPEDYELQLEEAEAALARARAEARNAEASYDRVRALYENRNASRQDLDAARAGSESATAQVEAAEKKVELARLQVGYTRLLAPVDGAIASVSVEVNENVASGREVVLLTAGGETKVTIAVPEALISGVREGDPATVTIDALPGLEFPATVTEVGVSATEMATTYPVTVLLDEESPEVRPGMAAEVAFRFGGADERERFLVPVSAVGEDGEGRFVFVIEPTEEGLGTAHRRAVSIGALTTEGIEVVRGLVDGDILVTAGVSRLEDGQTVKLPISP